jgi:16S rRNA (cytosine967-C5)-methyltransferase
MSRYHAYLNTAATIVSKYKGETPLALYLKQFFAANKKYGSTDRKQIAQLCYAYYRLGHAMPALPVAEKMLQAYFICNNNASAFLETLRPEWNRVADAPLPEKLSILPNPILPNEIFPFTNDISDTVQPVAYSQSFLQQPNLFLRIRPGHTDKVKAKMQAFDIQFIIEGNCVKLPSGTNTKLFTDADAETVVQDYNSQKVLDYLMNAPEKANMGKPKVWDCCAASGGKSILAYDIFDGNIELTVSDIRETILANLKQRFYNAGIKKYNSIIANLEAGERPIQNVLYDIIICDAPCTGSGTWARTPEQLFFFKPAAIAEFSRRQKAIAANAAKGLKTGGLFFYITCSVFKSENEVVAGWLAETQPLQLLEMKILEGYTIKADTMFVAVFLKK